MESSSIFSISTAPEVHSRCSININIYVYLHISMSCNKESLLLLFLKLPFTEKGRAG